MRKLALSDDILMKIEKPARYIGGEVNAVVKDLQNVDIRFAMCFPDVCGGRCPDSIIQYIQCWLMMNSTRYRYRMTLNNTLQHQMLL